jgi:RimJ/RimL family protein N-acetyltransferase
MEKFEINTERLLIRKLDKTDLIHFYAYRSNPDVTKYQGFEVMTKEQSRDFIVENAKKQFGEPDEWVQFAIEELKTAQLIGDCAIKLREHQNKVAEIGITISHLEQRKGYAKEALYGIMAFLFDNCQVNRIQEIVDADNCASIALIKSLGFKQEGHFVENSFFKGRWSSELQFAMLKKEWEKK